MGETVVLDVSCTKDDNQRASASTGRRQPAPVRLAQLNTEGSIRSAIHRLMLTGRCVAVIAYEKTARISAMAPA
jgi:hypothetical protein